MIVFHNFLEEMGYLEHLTILHIYGILYIELSSIFCKYLKFREKIRIVTAPEILSIISGILDDSSIGKFHLTTVWSASSALRTVHSQKNPWFHIVLISVVPAI